MKELIKKLTETFSPSGYEDAVREVILAEIRPLADEIRVDALGNIIAHKGKKTAKGKRVMVAAHMDEIGLIATHIDENGFVRFITVGIPFARYLLGGRVRFVNGVPGVIGSERPEKYNIIPPADKLFIDIGATGKKDCPVKVGDVAAFEPGASAKRRPSHSRGKGATWSLRVSTIWTEPGRLRMKSRRWAASRLPSRWMGGITAVCRRSLPPLRKSWGRSKSWLTTPPRWVGW